MKAASEDSKIILPSMSSLSHMSFVRVAIGLYNTVGIEYLSIFHGDIKFGNVTTSEQGTQVKSVESQKKANEVMLRVPMKWRKRMLDVVQHIHSEILSWKSDHSTTLELNDYFHIKFYWRCDGTIDRPKTAKEIVLNQNICIRKRFEIACMYCLVSDVTILWAKLEASKKTQISQRSVNIVLHFWVSWLRNGAPCPWTDHIDYFFTSPLIFTRLGFRIRFSSLFCQLKPETRHNFFELLGLCHADDFRSCLHLVTKEEEEEILKMFPIKVFRCYLNWPFQNEFLEVAKKMWNYLNYSHFGLVLEHLMGLVYRTDFDFKDLLIEFYNKSPVHFKEYARKTKILNEQIDLFFSGSKKRICDDIDGTSSKRFRRLDTEIDCNEYLGIY